jgi:hypothetical protein
MFRSKVVEEIKTHFLFHDFFLSLENRAFYEIMWQNIVQPSRPQMTIWRMLIASLITEATNSHSEYVILIAFPLQQWLQEHASLLLLYIHCPSSFFLGM